MEVVVALPFLEFVVEQSGVVDDDTVEEPVELLGVDAVRAFHLAVRSRGGRLGVGVADALVQDVAVERRPANGFKERCAETETRKNVPLICNPHRSGKLKLGESRSRTDELVTSTELQRHEGGARTSTASSSTTSDHHITPSSSLDQVTVGSPRS